MARHLLTKQPGNKIVATDRSRDTTTATDMYEFQQVFVTANIGDTGTFVQASESVCRFGMWVCFNVGLDQAAAK